jgi:hypothetical protein
MSDLVLRAFSAEINVSTLVREEELEEADVLCAIYQRLGEMNSSRSEERELVQVLGVGL